MTKEELELEAEEYANNIDYTTTVKMIDCVPYHENCDVADMIAEAYLAGAEPREKRIAELEAQIEKMKCCGNCKRQCSFLFQDEIDCANNGLPKWEIKEK